MKAPPDLVLLTATYPFGNKSETFLETEIEVLAQRFSRVFVLPSHREEGVRPLPANVSLVEMDWLTEPSGSAKMRALGSASAASVMLRTLTQSGNWRPYVSRGRMYLDLLARNLLKARSLGEFIQTHRLSRAVFYDYWFENSTLALALLRRSGVIATAVSRGHRFDIYDECWDGCPVPFREYKAAGLDRVFPVSRFGMRYLHDRSPHLQGKLQLAKLGVESQPEPATAPGSLPLVASCSSMLPRKRVELIPSVLRSLGRPLRWVHLGDGPERPVVERALAGLPESITWELRGHVDNDEVVRFYRENYVDAFVSLSVSEGLPVSMMEAQSFGIPILAIGVHGVPEIVNDATGVLLEPEATVEAMAEGLTTALDPDRFDRAEIRHFFSEHFEAGTNYNAFADALIALWEDQAPAA